MEKNEILTYHYSGFVQDQETGNYIPGVRIYCDNNKITVTDDTGHFDFEYEKSTCDIKVQKRHYECYEIKGKASYGTINILLQSKHFRIKLEWILLCIFCIGVIFTTLVLYKKCNTSNLHYSESWLIFNKYKIVKTGNFYGVLSLSDSVIAMPLYDEMQKDSISETIWLRKDSIWSFVYDNKVLSNIPIHSDTLCNRVKIVYEKGHVSTESNNKYVNRRYGYVNDNGQIVIPALYTDISSFYGQYNVASKGEKKAILNILGVSISKFEFDDIDLHFETNENGYYDLVKVKGNGLYGLWSIEKKRLVIQNKYLNLYSQNNKQYVKVKDQRGKFNFYFLSVDREPCLVSQQWFDETHDFSQANIVAVKSGADWYFIRCYDGKAVEICDSRFKSVHDFKNEYAVVQVDDGYKYLNVTGELFGDKISDNKEISFKSADDITDEYRCGIVQRRDGTYAIVKQYKSGTLNTVFHNAESKPELFFQIGQKRFFICKIKGKKGVHIIRDDTNETSNNFPIIYTFPSDKYKRSSSGYFQYEYIKGTWKVVEITESNVKVIKTMPSDSTMVKINEKNIYFY